MHLTYSRLTNVAVLLGLLTSLDANAQQANNRDPDSIVSIRKAEVLPLTE